MTLNTNNRSLNNPPAKYIYQVNVETINPDDGSTGTEMLWRCLIWNNKYLHLPGKCILLVVNKE
jgi:hypothetical protein